MPDPQMDNELPLVPIGVKDPGFTLDLIARECPPQQYQREFTENGKEAIDAYRRRLDPGFTGKVVWIHAPASLGLPAPKLACVDTGIGMAADELPSYLNDLTASGKDRSLHGNYGVGAKVSAARFNPAGVQYFSWRDGIGSFVEFGRDRHGNWGMRQHRLPDGSVAAVLRVPDELKPDELRGLDHGTMVVFLGERADHDTTLPPDGVEFRDYRWIAKYLNRRYYRLPDWLEIRVREDRGGGCASRRLIRGQKAYLDEHTQAQGMLEITGARVHWRVLNADTETRRNDGSIWASTGHRAALYGDELYEMISPARGGYQKLQEFGIHSGYGRVVLYVEPTGDVGAMTDTARGSSSTGSRCLGTAMPRSSRPTCPMRSASSSRRPWDPAAATAADPRAACCASRSYSRSRYKPQPRGLLEMDDPTTGHTRDRDTDAPEREPRKRPSPPWTGPAGGNVYALMLHADGPQAYRARTDELPDITVDWVSAEDRRFSLRVVPHLEDRAARYDLRHNRLEINYDFRGLQDLLNRWLTQYKTVPGAKTIIEETVMGWYEQQLTETVLSILALRGSEYWDDRRIAEALSEIALTAAAGPRYHLDTKVKQELAQRFSAGRRAAA
ncbi:MAG: hypothetical protein U0S48_18560 [Solirubrobacteraceae bacterium]